MKMVSSCKKGSALNWTRGQKYDQRSSHSNCKASR